MAALQALSDPAPTPLPTQSPTPKVLAATGGSAVGSGKIRLGRRRGGIYRKFYGLPG